MSEEYNWRAIDAFFYYRGRLARPPKLRSGLWHVTLCVRNGAETFFPTVTLQELPPGLEFRDDQPIGKQILLSIVGVPATRNVTYTVIDEMDYILRRAGFPAVLPFLERVLPEQVRKAPIRHVLTSFRGIQVSIEEIPNLEG